MPSEDPLDVDPNGSEPEKDLDFDVLDADEDLAPDLPDPENVSSEVKNTFWGVFLLVKLGVLATSIGALLLTLTPYMQAGAVALIVGLFSLGHAYVKYRFSEFG